ncbi:hypothetical protein SAMN06265348_11256 [Pedobacter westerhofensis]|uniref:Uncharacterized protein n=1 Tax=Pedobacter westerhofensis TaxID=425512 RepID=A0A521FGG5_9SPHI|nr:hypothetical protein SAMN06265348_11256 [Pedobacter westerhofensis]
MIFILFVDCPYTVRVPFCIKRASSALLLPAHYKAVYDQYTNGIRLKYGWHMSRTRLLITPASIRNSYHLFQHGKCADSLNVITNLKNLQRINDLCVDFIKILVADTIWRQDVNDIAQWPHQDSFIHEIVI